MSLPVIAINLLYFLIGLVSWYCALRRTICCIKGQRKLVSLIVFCEELLGFACIYFIVVDKNWIAAILYAIGGSIGAYFVTPDEVTDKKGK